MPLLFQDDVPAKYQARLIPSFIKRTEFVIPPINALCTISNIVVAIACYSQSGKSRTAAAKFPWVVAATALGISVTAWSLSVMVPINKQMVECHEQLEKDDEESTKSKEVVRQFRELQASWCNLNSGELFTVIRVQSTVEKLTLA